MSVGREGSARARHGRRARVSRRIQPIFSLQPVPGTRLTHIPIQPVPGTRLTHIQPVPGTRLTQPPPPTDTTAPSPPNVEPSRPGWGRGLEGRGVRGRLQRLVRRPDAGRALVDRVSTSILKAPWGRGGVRSWQTSCLSADYAEGRDAVRTGSSQGAREQNSARPPVPGTSNATLSQFFAYFAGEISLASGPRLFALHQNGRDFW